MIHWQPAATALFYIHCLCRMIVPQMEAFRAEQAAKSGYDDTHCEICAAKVSTSALGWGQWTTLLVRSKAKGALLRSQGLPRGSPSRLALPTHLLTAGCHSNPSAAPPCANPPCPATPPPPACCRRVPKRCCCATAATGGFTCTAWTLPWGPPRWHRGTVPPACLDRSAHVSAVGWAAPAWVLLGRSICAGCDRGCCIAGWLACPFRTSTAAQQPHSNLIPTPAHHCPRRTVRRAGRQCQARLSTAGARPGACATAPLAARCATQAACRWVVSWRARGSGGI